MRQKVWKQPHWCGLGERQELVFGNKCVWPHITSNFFFFFKPRKKKFFSCLCCFHKAKHLTQTWELQYINLLNQLEPEHPGQLAATTHIHTGTHPKNCKTKKKASEQTDWACCSLTCTTCTGGPLRSSTGSSIPVHGGLWWGEHPTLTQRGSGCCKGLAALIPSRLVHGIWIGNRHGHMHGEVLLGQRCGLKETDKHKY